jgi:uncharacterized protein (UPF0332 family)
MTSPELDRLVSTGLLQKEPPGGSEINGLIASADARLADARRGVNSLDSRFDLAYNAVHALATAALRSHGYRAQKRYVVFQTLGLTLGVDTVTWRVLDRCHRARNETEYQGATHVNEKMVADLIAAASVVQDALHKLVRSRPKGR